MKTFAALLIAILAWQAPAQADPAELQARRDQLREVMGEQAIAVLFPEEFRTRSADVRWPYRQANHLYYLTHATHPGTHLLLVNSGRDRGAYLFAKLSDPSYEVWEGRLPTVEQLQAESGIENIYPEKQFPSAMRRLLNGVVLDPEPESNYEEPEFGGLFQHLLHEEVEVWLELGRYRRLESPRRPTRAQDFAAQLRERFPEVRIRNLTPVLESMRRTKSEQELAIMQRAIDITGEAHLEAMKRAPGASHEYQVQATIEHTFRDRGACCWAFPSIVASGDNATILHYGENNAPLDKGSLLLIDIGAEVDYYSADITRTFPVSGKFSTEQRLIYDLVLAAQRKSIAAAKPGATMQELEQASIRRMAKGLLEMGLIAADEDEQVKSYFLHGLGHSVGLDTHDAFEYYLKLDRGMVVTIEPGIYVRPQDVVKNAWYSALDDEARGTIDAALDRFGGIGVRIEDQILITRRGASVMSADIPVEADEIEQIMAASIAP